MEIPGSRHGGFHRLQQALHLTVERLLLAKDIHGMLTRQPDS